ncbi:MAG: hypothetical protein LBH17_02795 [Oscillospiraceae bacterium]|nr:hypothetical protein [Oscillospiraceae bacterium]
MRVPPSEKGAGRDVNLRGTTRANSPYATTAGRQRHAAIRVWWSGGLRFIVFVGAIQNRIRFAVFEKKAGESYFAKAAIISPGFSIGYLSPIYIAISIVVI